jgi:hypothetical protein
MRAILIVSLIWVLPLDAWPLTLVQAADAVTEFEAVRTLILKGDYFGAQNIVTQYRSKTLKAVRQSPNSGTPPKDLMAPPTASDRDHLLLLLDQASQAHALGDLWYALKYANTLCLALQQEHLKTRPTPAQRQEQVEQLIQSSTGTRRMMALSLSAKAAFEAGDFEKARNYSSESLRLADPSKRTWRQSDALYSAHIIAGRLALRSQDLDGARRHLTESLATVSSAPSVAAMGPDIPFAAELVAAGENDAVLKDLAECAKWWKADEGKTAEWSELIRQGRQPWAEWMQLHPPAR